MKDKFDTEYDAFYKYVLQGVDMLNLADWRIETYKKSTKNVYATTQLYYRDKLAVILFNPKNHKGDINEQSIRDTAFHELCEILLYPIEFAIKEKMSERQIDAVRHSVINVIVRLMVNIIEKNKGEK